MFLRNMKSNKGNDVPNQFIIDDGVDTYFQSYKTIIAKFANIDGRQIKLDKNSWDYSNTTSKYRNIFLGMTTKEIKEKIKTGEIELVDLNI